MALTPFPFAAAMLLTVPAFAADTAPPAISGPMTATTYEAGLSPAQAGARLVQAIIAGDPPEQIAPFFEESLGPSVTVEAIQGLRQQLTWMSDVLGDALQVFAQGSRPHEGGLRIHFREYRFANEMDKRHPLAVAQVMFSDSLTNKASGIFIKSFLRESGERRLSDGQVWKVGPRALQVHSIGVMELNSVFVLFVRVEDSDTTNLATREAALPYTAPIAREAVAQGWLDSARAIIGDSPKPLIDEVGVLFIRVDPGHGYVHIRHTARADEYAAPMRKSPEKKPTAKKSGTRKGK